MEKMKRITRIEPASGAIIMANGIFLIGALEQFPWLDQKFGIFFALLLVSAWGYIYTKLTIQFFNRQFLIPFLKNPLQSFTVGTWIAGVSVLCNVLLKYFPKILLLIQWISLLNTILFLSFFLLCLYNFKKLFISKEILPVHGVILLSTVGTQSVVILLNNVFFELPNILSSGIIFCGLIFYLLGLFLLIRRYLWKKNWTFANDWANTNCIIHGALSITGLAIVTSNTYSSSVVTLLWLMIASFILGVEFLEGIRAIQRIKIYGVKKGLLIYHITQWSRNFTFGMFYAFTSAMYNNSRYILPTWLEQILPSFLAIWAWVVLLFLLTELLIFFHHSIKTIRMKSPILKQLC